LKINISVIKYYLSVTEAAICMAVNLLICCFFSDFDQYLRQYCIIFGLDIRLWYASSAKARTCHTMCNKTLHRCSCDWLSLSPILIWHWVRRWQIN